MRGREEGKEEWKEQRNGGRKIAYSWRQVEQLQHGRKKGGEEGREGRRKERKPATRTWSTELGRQVTTPTSSQLK